MAYYIDRQELIEALNEQEAPYNATINYIILAMPRADVRENKRGKWIAERDVYSFFTCSECAKTFETERAYNFCPNCGADMQEDNNL